MGFLDTIKGWFGIGQPTVEAAASTTTLKRGGFVSVTITMTGGDRDLPLTALVLKLKAERDLGEEGGTTWDTLAEETAWFGDQIIASGEVVETRLTIQVPADCDPTGGTTTHELVASADVPGWDPETKISVTITAEADEMAGEDHSRYHILESERNFRNSSVRGDFRVWPLVGGGAVHGWNTSGAVARDDDGTERWRSTYGRTMAIATDGTVVAADGKNVAWIDAATGTPKHVIHAGDWVNNIVPLPDGKVALNVTSKVLIMDAQGEIVREITSLGGDDDLFIGGMCEGLDGDIVVIDANARLLASIDPVSGEIKRSKELGFHPADVYKAAAMLVLDCNEQICFADAELKVRGDFELPGREGIRFKGQSEHSYTHFKPNARLSPDGERILLNDQSGMLWLLTKKGQPIRTWGRETLDFVEDANWLDDARFVAITNDGRSHGVDATTGSIAWSHSDL